MLIFFILFHTFLFASNYVHAKLKRRFDVAYDPYTFSIQVVDNLEKLEKVAKNIESQLGKLNGALHRLNLAKA